MNGRILREILRKHELWLKGEDGGERANLVGADLKGAKLTGIDLRHAILINANLEGADLSYANLKCAMLTGANLKDAETFGTSLRGVKLRNANLNGVNLDGVNLIGANLSGATGIKPQREFIRDNFESTADGIIAYKAFDIAYEPPERWKIEKGSVITENVDFDRSNSCSYGINVASIKWFKEKNCKSQIWKVLIRWEWLAGVCVPYGSNGVIRCECVELLQIVDENPRKEQDDEKRT